MNTVVVWLLISVGSSGGHTSRPSQVLERFADRAECIRVMNHLNGPPISATVSRVTHIHTCIDARIYVPK